MPCKARAVPTAIPHVTTQVPYKYDLSRFCPVNAVSFDHPGPSLGLHSGLAAHPSVAKAVTYRPCSVLSCRFAPQPPLPRLFRPPADPSIFTVLSVPSYTPGTCGSP
jgi:homogentisate 1,2-dioxygenase